MKIVSSGSAFFRPIVNEVGERPLREFRSFLFKDCAALIRNVNEVDPMICHKCGVAMKVIAFLTEYAIVDRIIDHLKLTFMADRPPASHVFEQIAFMAAEERGEYL